MADQANINQAIKTVQGVLERYTTSYYGGTDATLVHDQLPEGLYEQIENFIYELSGIDIAERKLNAAGIVIDDAYDPALMPALQTFATSPAFNAFRTAITNADQEAINRFMREHDLPAAFAQSPQKLIDFIDQDLEPFIEAMEVLEQAEHLYAPPLSLEEKRLQEETLPKMEALLRQAYPYYIDFLQDSMARDRAILQSNPEEAVRIETQYRIDSAHDALATLNKGFAALQEADFNDYVKDDNAHIALEQYIVFLQRHNSYTKFDDKSGQYTPDFDAHLAAVMQSSQTRLKAFEGKENLSDRKKQEYQFIKHYEPFQAIMTDMVASAAYRMPSLNLNGQTMHASDSIVNNIVDTMVRKNYVHVSPPERSENSGVFDMGARMALQAFVIDMKKITRYGGDQNNGIYSEDFALYLNDRLRDPGISRFIADRYFEGDMQSVAGLAAALDRYCDSTQIPDLPGQSSNISQVNLISKPYAREAELEVLQIAVLRIPESELAGMNALVATLSGYGLEDFMRLSDDSSEAARLSQIMNYDGQSRVEVLGELFSSVYHEATGELERDGRSLDELHDEMSRRITERLEDFTKGTAVFAGNRVRQLEEHIENAVSVALTTGDSMQSNHADKLAAAAHVFGLTIPSPEKFTMDYGAHRPGGAIFSQKTMMGLMPKVLPDFGGQVAKSSADLGAVMEMQTIDMMVADMVEDFDRFNHSPIAGVAIQEVEAHLMTNKAILETAYEQCAALGPNGELIVKDRNGERVLLSHHDDEGLQIRYLDALGVADLRDADIPVISMAREFAYDAALIKTAMAGFQSKNQAVQNVNHYAPEFFELAGRHYVVGIDRETSMVQVKELDPEFLSMEHARMLTYATGPNARSDIWGIFMDNDAYRFIRENYSAVYSPAGSPDRIFQSMLQEVAKGQGMAGHSATQALGLFEQYVGLGSLQEVPIADLPRVSDEGLLREVQNVAVRRPVEVNMQPFLYMRNEGGNPQILLSVPAIKTSENGQNDNQDSSAILDSEADPFVVDISDPEVFMRMRDRLIRWNAEGVRLQLDIVPPEALAADEFRVFKDWLDNGARPLQKLPDNAAPSAPGVDGAQSALESGNRSGGDFATLFQENCNDIICGPAADMIASRDLVPAQAGRMNALGT
tara:strand:+ start:387 stop:3803 length:3417 start_codon:yes stop_codon:yes gene_type:complete